MSRPTARRLANLLTSHSKPSRSFCCSEARCQGFGTERTAKLPVRPKTQDFIENVLNGSSSSRNQAALRNTMDEMTSSVAFQTLDNKPIVDTGILSGTSNDPPQRREDEMEPYHFHVYSHKHNTHITCTKPNREPIISMSCGNIGYRKSRRGTFDSAYSLAKYVLERLIHTGWPMKIRRLELVLRGFGQGREAAVKVLMSPEGKVLRDKIIRVADSTRIKFGGTRSEKPRRL